MRNRVDTWLYLVYPKLRRTCLNTWAPSRRNGLISSAEEYLLGFALVPVILAVGL